MKPFSVAGAVEVMLVVIEASFHFDWLPLGGGHIQQLGIVLGVAFALDELFEGLGHRDRESTGTP